MTIKFADVAFGAEFIVRPQTLLIRCSSTGRIYPRRVGLSGRFRKVKWIDGARWYGRKYEWFEGGISTGSGERAEISDGVEVEPAPSPE